MQQHRSTPPPPTRIAIAPPLDAATTINSQHDARASSADDTARVLRGLEQIDSTDAIAMSSLLALDALSSPAAVVAPLTTQHVAAHSLLSLSPSLSAAVAKKAADELDLNRLQSDTSDMTVEAATLLTTVTAAIPAAHPPMPSRTLRRRSARSPLTIVPPPQGSIRAFIAQTHLFTGPRQRTRADAAEHSNDRRIDVTADRMKTEAAATVDEGETNGNSDGGDDDDEDQVNGDEETPRDNDEEMSDGGYRAMTGDIALSPTTQNIHNILMIAKQQQMEQSMQRAHGHYRHDRHDDSHVEALELETTSDVEHNDDAMENGSGGASSDEEDSDDDRRTTHRARKKDDSNTARRRRRPSKRAEPARTRERDHSHGKDKRRTARAKSSTSDRRTLARGRAADNNSGDEEEAHDDGDEAPTYTPQNKRRKNKRQQQNSADDPQQAIVAHDVQHIPTFLKHHVIHDAAANALAEAVAASAFSNALPHHSRPDMQNLLDGSEIASQRKKRQRKRRDAATDLLTTVAALVPPLDTTINETALHAAKTLSAAAAALPSASLASRREVVSPIGVPKKRRLSSKVHTYSCPICAKSFNDASSLRKHLKIHGDRQFQCDECDKRFIDNSKLKRHQLVHSGERKFICPYPGCNKKFALDFNLKSHSRVHTGEKPFPCAHPNCGRRFAQVSNLKAHYKTHSAAATTTSHAASSGGRSTTPNTLGDTATVDTAVVINGALYPPFFPTAIPTAGAYLNSANVSVIATTPRAHAANANSNNHNYGFDATTTTTSTQHT